MVKRRMPRVYLVRHGETEWSINGRHARGHNQWSRSNVSTDDQTGVSDIPLTANGERMVKEMAPRMVGEKNLIHPDQIRHILVSPRQRAQKTAALLFGDNKPPKSSFTTDEEVGEWKYGAYEGMLTKDIREKQPGWDIWRDGCPDGDVPGESPQEMSDRVDRTIARIRKVHQEAEDAADKPENAESCDYMIFSHGHYTRCFIARWCGFDISAGYHFSADPGCLAVLGYQHNTLKEPSLLGLNWYTEEAMQHK